MSGLRKAGVNLSNLGVDLECSENLPAWVWEKRDSNQTRYRRAVWLPSCVLFGLSVKIKCQIRKYVFVFLASLSC